MRNTNREHLSDEMKAEIIRRMALLMAPATPQAREDALSCILADRARITAAYHSLRDRVSRYTVQIPDIAEAIRRAEEIREGRS